MIQAKQDNAKGTTILLRCRISARTGLNIGNISVEEESRKQEMLKSISLCSSYKLKVTRPCIHKYALSLDGS